MLMDAFNVPSFYIGYLIIFLLFLELLSLVVLRYFPFESSTKELRGTNLMNPFFEQSDSYNIHDIWRQEYNVEINEMFKSSNQALNRWQPLGLWSAPRYHGKHVNIEKYNLRRTVHLKKMNTQQAKLRIYFFGGSHVWGWGARDENTIPSQLSNLRNNAIIENHGQLGYVSSQSVIAFIQRLKYEPKPDIVIFIDGFNDIYSAYQSNIAGIEQNAISRKQRFESKSSEGIFEFYQKKSNFIKLIRSVFHNEKSNNLKNLKDSNDLLAHSIIFAYNQNVFLVNKIAAAYNFKSFFIWPPTIFDKLYLTEYERKLPDIINSFKPLYTSVKSIICAGNIFPPSVFDLSSLFCQNKNPIYADPWHYNENGNFLIAERINELITLAL